MLPSKSILIFGTGRLQQSLIEGCQRKGLFTVGIDPNPEAECRGLVDVFEVVDGNDFETTLSLAQKYRVAGVITAATDKPLVMMAQVAEKMKLPFFSVDTAHNATDKLLMKQKLMAAHLPCAKGFLVARAAELPVKELAFPVIVKPRDNSGSRGVLYCDKPEAFAAALEAALKFTKKDAVLVEEYIGGQEYSIEALHYDGEHRVVQFTEKSTTDFPYNVEIAHIQPADLSPRQRRELGGLVAQIGQAMGFENCASHTEIKLNSKGVFIIETSPRLGGGYISSSLVPLSTGFDLEGALIDLSIGLNGGQAELNVETQKHSGIKFFQLAPGTVSRVGRLDALMQIEGCRSYAFDLHEGQRIPQLTSGLDRYGYAIFQAQSRDELTRCMGRAEALIAKEISIEEDGSGK